MGEETKVISIIRRSKKTMTIADVVALIFWTIVVWNIAYGAGENAAKAKFIRKMGDWEYEPKE